MNVNISTGQSDPKLQPESEYPAWIWSARGPCRAALKSETIMAQDQIPIISESKSEIIGSEKELELAKLKRMLRTENRKRITEKNSMLLGTN